MEERVNGRDHEHQGTLILLVVFFSLFVLINLIGINILMYDNENDGKHHDFNRSFKYNKNISDNLYKSQENPMPKVSFTYF